MPGSVTTIIIEILTGKLDVPPEEVSQDSVLDDLSIDSLALLEISLTLEKRLGVSIAEGTLNAQQTVAEAAGTVAALASATAA